MVTTSILPFHPSHMVGLKPIRKADLLSLGGFDPIALGHKYYLAGPARSYFVGHEIIAVIGIMSIWSGVGEVWMLTTDKVDKHKEFFHSSTVELMTGIVKTLKLHRVQCTVDSRNEKAIRWMSKLGFEQEAVHRMYGPDKVDHLRFARLWQD